LNPATCGLLAILLAASVACHKTSAPTAPTPVAAPPVSAPPTPAPTPTPAPPANASSIAVAMPIDPADALSSFYGLGPFGYHGADHAEDGHPGWDVEYRLGASVRAAADGTVQSVFADAFNPAVTTVQLMHSGGTRGFRTVYTNLTNIPPGIAAGAPVQRGQPIGTAATITAMQGSGLHSYAITHFQLDDFSADAGLTNRNAVSPENFLTADGRVVFDRIWAAAAYVHELVEPHPTNPRDVTFPLTRVWTRESGSGPAAIAFTRQSGRATDYDFEIRSDSGGAADAGRVTLNISVRPFPALDLGGSGGSRLGIYDIVGDRMRLALGNPGAPRPSDLSNATVYRTPR
jgi:hypothetical protein